MSENRFTSGIKAWNQRTRLMIQGFNQVMIFALIITFIWCLYRICSTIDWKSVYYFYVECKVQCKALIAKIINAKDFKINFYLIGQKQWMTVPIGEYSYWFWKKSISGKKILKLLFWFENKAFWELLKVFFASFVFGIGIFTLYGRKLFAKVKSGIELVNLENLKKSLSLGICRR